MSPTPRGGDADSALPFFLPPSCAGVFPPLGVLPTALARSAWPGCACQVGAKRGGRPSEGLSVLTPGCMLSFRERKPPTLRELWEPRRATVRFSHPRPLRRDVRLSVEAGPNAPAGAAS